MSMGCLKLAHIKESKPVLKCVWNAQKQPKTGVGMYDYGARFYKQHIEVINCIFCRLHCLSSTSLNLANITIKIYVI